MTDEHTAETYHQRITKDTYEASYYLKYGAYIIGVRQVAVPRNKVARRGFSYQWIITMGNVPASRISLWQMDKAIEKVSDIVSARRRLKREVKRLLQRTI